MELEGYSVNLEHYGICNGDNSLVCGDIYLREERECTILEVDIKCRFEPYDYAVLFERYQSVVITVNLEKCIRKMFAQRVASPFWTEPAFLETKLSDEDKLQYALLNNGEENIFVLPIANSSFYTTIRKGRENNCIDVSVNKVSPDGTHIKGIAAVITKNKNPYKAIALAFEHAVNSKYILTPLKKNKIYPEELEYLGWCTWNAFYHDVSEEKILEKLSEFREKKIPVKWVLIDDGWSELSENKLKSIYEDKNKFPLGLKHTIDVMKNEYGIQSVGVWHAATGYWRGIDFENEDTYKTNLGIIVPCGYAFFSKWHRYLKEQGVDFIKVDAQGNLFEFLKNSGDSLEKIVNIIHGLEKSSKENFKFMINCMGLGNINMFSRAYSSLLRTSDDFFPDVDNVLESHVINNVYNAVFNDHLYFCDYDMWWSKHPEAKQNAVLRYMSGGPFYLSDQLEQSDGELIKMFVDENGKIGRFDHAAKPSADCIFGYDTILKIFNTKGELGAVAVFSFGDSGYAYISAADFGETGRYTVKDFFSGETTYLDTNDKMKVEVEKNDVKLFLFSRVCD